MSNPMQLAQMIYTAFGISMGFLSGDLLVPSLVPILAGCAVMYHFLLAHIPHACLYVLCLTSLPAEIYCCYGILDWF